MVQQGGKRDHFQPTLHQTKIYCEHLGITSRTQLTKYFGELFSANILSPAKDRKEVYYINDDLVQILKG